MLNFGAFRDKNWKAISLEMLFHSFGRVKCHDSLSMCRFKHCLVARVERFEYGIHLAKCLVLSVLMWTAGKPCLRRSLPDHCKQPDSIAMTELLNQIYGILNAELVLC